MCGSDDGKKQTVDASGGEGGEPNGGMSAAHSGGSANPTDQGGAGAGAASAAGSPAGGEPASSGGMSSAGASPEGGAAGAPAVVGAAGAAFCAADAIGCCSPDEPSCQDGWPAPCGQDMGSHSCCDAGVRQTCSVDYFDSNYHVRFAKEDCACAGGACECACVKGDACPYDEADCNDPSWHDTCTLGNSPTCCDSTNGVRQRCDFAGEKVFSGSPVIDACTGEGFGTGTCAECLNLQDPTCDQAFFDGCSGEPITCSDATVGYRLSCSNGTSNVICTCDPQLVIVD